MCVISPRTRQHHHLPPAALLRAAGAALRHLWTRDHRARTLAAMPSFAGASSSSRAAVAAMDFNELNSDAFHHVFKFLEPKDLGACARVCKVWYEETQSPLLWRELCVRDHRINPQEYHSVRDWAAEYRCTLAS